MWVLAFKSPTECIALLHPFWLQMVLVHRLPRRHLRPGSLDEFAVGQASASTEDKTPLVNTWATLINSYWPLLVAAGTGVVMSYVHLACKKKTIRSPKNNTAKRVSTDEVKVSSCC